MRTLQVVPSIGEEAAGPSYSVPAICRALGANNAPTCLATVDSKFISSSEGFEHVRFRASFGPKTLSRSVAMKMHLKRNISNFDIVHNHSLWALPNIYACQIAVEAGVPLVISPRGTLHPRALSISRHKKKLFGALIQNRLLKSAVAIHATSQEEAKHIRAFGLEQPIMVLPNGVSLPKFEFLAPQGHDKTLLYFGRIHPIKGLLHLIEAWGNLSEQRKNDGWKLQIVGADSTGHTKELKAAVANRNIPRVSFGSPVYGAEKFQLLGSANLYILPTESENFGMTVAEALACGTPVLTTKGAPWSDLITHNCGWWVDVGVLGIEAGLSQALSTSTLELSEMGANGRKLVADKYAWQSIAERMRGFYEWIIAGKDPADRPPGVDML